MTELPTGTVTLMFTDIQGSTRLLESLDEEYAAVVRGHHRIVRDVLERHGGQELRTYGDAFERDGAARAAEMLAELL